MGEIVKRALSALAAARSGPPEIWITLFDEDAILAAAAAVEARLDTGPALPLGGLTIAVKDNIDVAGLPTTAACPAYAYAPAEDAPAVAALVAAGGVVIGKTNMDQFATGLVGTRSPCGIVRNPVDPRYIAGGSSSGSAVAVALAQVDLALATDTAGSGRVPAALNGIVGFKPTQALVSRAGVVPACPSFDCVSVLAPTLEFARAAAYALCPNGLPTARPIRRIGVPDTLPVALDAERMALWAAATERVRAGEVSLHEVDLSDFLAAGSLLYEGSLVAERYAAIGEFAIANPAAVDPVVLRVLTDAAAIPAHALVRDIRRLTELHNRVADVFSRVDALMVPTAGRHPTVEEVVADPTGPNHHLGLYNHFCNPLNLAAVTVPAGRTSAGLPFGINFYGPAGTDVGLLNLAARFLGEATDPSTEQPGTLVAVAGAHLRGQPLNHQLVELGARFVEQTTTADHYRLYALDTEPPKPGLVRVAASGAPIEVEVWSMDEQGLAQLVSSTPWPLAFGEVELAGGRTVIGFVCQAGAELSAADITSYRGWRAYIGAHERSRSQ